MVAKGSGISIGSLGVRWIATLPSFSHFGLTFSFKWTDLTCCGASGSSLEVNVSYRRTTESSFPVLVSLLPVRGTSL